MFHLSDSLLRHTVNELFIFPRPLLFAISESCFVIHRLFACSKILTQTRNNTRYIAFVFDVSVDPFPISILSFENNERKASPNVHNGVVVMPTAMTFFEIGSLHFILFLRHFYYFYFFYSFKQEVKSFAYIECY